MRFRSSRFRSGHGSRLRLERRRGASRAASKLIRSWSKSAARSSAESWTARELADVADAVERDAAAEVVREALVDGEAPVLLGADEVRVREAPEGDEEEDARRGRARGRRGGAAGFRRGVSARCGGASRLLGDGLPVRGRLRSEARRDRGLEPGQRVLELAVSPWPFTGIATVSSSAGLALLEAEEDDRDVVLAARCGWPP